MSSPTSVDLRAARQARLQATYSHLLDLLLHESRFVLERTNTYILTNSILFTGYVVCASSRGISSVLRGILIVLLPLLGVFISAVQPLILARTIDALAFWRASLGLIEQDPDFWYPERTELDIDLDLTKARQRHWWGIPTRQSATPLPLGSVPDFLQRIARSFVLDPNSFFAIALPAAVTGLWLVALIWGIHTL
jgi:hypothetical protein